VQRNRFHFDAAFTFFMDCCIYLWVFSLAEMIVRTGRRGEIRGKRRKKALQKTVLGWSWK